MFSRIEFDLSIQALDSDPPYPNRALAIPMIHYSIKIVSNNQSLQKMRLVGPPEATLIEWP